MSFTQNLQKIGFQIWIRSLGLVFEGGFTRLWTSLLDKAKVECKTWPFGFRSPQDIKK